MGVHVCLHVCMYECVYACVYVDVLHACVTICVCMYICIHGRMFLCISGHVCMGMYAWGMSVDMYACTDLFVCAYVGK